MEGGGCRFHPCTHFLDEEMEAHSGQARGSSLSCFMASSHDPAGFPSHCAPLPQPIPFLGALLKLFWTLRSHAELAQCQDTVPLHSPFTIGQCGLCVLLDRQHLVMESSVTWRRGGGASCYSPCSHSCLHSECFWLFSQHCQGQLSWTDRPVFGSSS